HSARDQDFSSHQFPESKYGPRCSIIFPDLSALRTCAGVSSSCKTDAKTDGRKRRKAAVACAALSASESGPDWFTPLGTADSTAAHENGCMRNASGRCVSSKTGVPIRSAPTRAVKRESDSEI